MDISEWLGFIISMLALLILFLRRGREGLQRKANPEEYEEKKKQHETLKGFLKSLDMDIDEDEEESASALNASSSTSKQKSETLEQPKKKYPQERIVKDEFSFKSSLEQYKPKTKIEERQFKTDIDDRYKNIYGERIVSVDLRRDQSQAYEVIRTESSSSISRLLKKLPSKKEMVLLHEIMSRPKGY